MTRGTRVFMPCPAYCLISTASTSAGSILVYELHNSPEFSGNLIGDEDQTYLTSLQVCLDPLPELLRSCFVVQELREILFGIFAIFFKTGTKRFNGPVNHRVGSVVEHLADHFAPDAGISAAFDLDDSWNRILIEEQVIHRPPSSAILLGVAGYQQPVSWLVAVDLVSSQ